MVYTTRDKIADLFLFLYLVSFPFGQLLRMQVQFGSNYLAVFPNDIFLFFFIGFAGLKLKTLKPLRAFFSVVLFSYLLNYFIYNFSPMPGLGYVVRLFTYLVFWFSAADFTKRKKLTPTVQNLVIAILTAVSIFGWLQYLIYPDLRFLFAYGWDDHLNRLAGTFFDPGFTGLLLCFGFIVCLVNFLHSKKKIYGFLAGVFLVSVGFTYSRASILALAVSLVFVLVKFKKYFLIVVGILVILMGIYFLPKKQGQGTNLTRLYSINLRLENYQQTFAVFSENPVFGVGYNNLCQTKNTKENSSHACSGADNSILFIASTLGVFGLFALIYFLYLVMNATAANNQGIIFLTFLVALFVHSQFVNSIFYPWVLGVLGLQYAISRKED